MDFCFHTHHSPLYTLRGNRQDEGASPMSRRWREQLKRLLRPTAQENRKGRLGSPSRGERWGEWGGSRLQGGVMGTMRRRLAPGLSLPH
ncbi:MAG: hypothetical protein OXU61_09430 [Gammaproteobacteria bacterium]|nr:hypothetical protein [Gammaproteobacteria bacterium]